MGITERTALKIVADRDLESYIERHRKGRRNVYRINLDTTQGRHLTPQTSPSPTT